MNIDKKIRSKTSKSYLRKGALEIIGGLAGIVLSVTLWGRVLSDSEYSSNRYTDEYYEKKFGTTNKQNIELLKTGNEAMDYFIDYGIPLMIIGISSIGIYSGIKNLGNAKTYKYDSTKIDYTSEEYKKWQIPKQ